MFEAVRTKGSDARKEDMTEKEKQPPNANSEAGKGDGAAKLIHDLATSPPVKDMANLKAASDVVEANKDDTETQKKDRRHEERSPAHS